jgi:hypothetical protein
MVASAGSVIRLLARRVQPLSPLVDPIGLDELFLFTMGLSASGMMVILVWLVLALGQRWSADPTWIDRTGRVIGGLWIIVSLLYFVAVAIVV